MTRRLATLARGRIALTFEPRDIWIGAYVAEDYVYVCPLPLLVVRWERRDSWRMTQFVQLVGPLTLTAWQRDIFLRMLRSAGGRR